jgi:hypothetical protein
LPADGDAWADALDHLDSRSDEMVPVGRQRAKQYTTAKAGAGLRAAYETALGGWQ